MIEQLTVELEQFGLHFRGITRLLDSEIAEYKLSGKSVALVGNIGSSYWPIFSASDEYNDGDEDPLDRWSKRVATSIVSSQEVNLTAVFPSDGPPWLPFLQWAERAQPVKPSPLGITIHPDYGLWHSYRFAFILPEIYQTPFESVSNACESCIDQPCLNTCPVSAFSLQGYDFERCAHFLHSQSDADCLKEGCQARNACPVAPQYRYLNQQHRFHLNAFLKSHR